MPDIDELLKKSSKKKFKKTNLRPWDYLENIESSEVKNELSNIAQNDAPDDSINRIVDNEINDKNDNRQIDQKNEVIEKEQESDISAIPVRIKKDISKKTQAATNISMTISRLFGQQKKFFDYILKKCLASNSLESGFLLRADLLASIECTSINALNTVISRLTAKGLLFRVTGKRGPGGFFCFRVAPEVLKEVKRMNWESE